MQARSTPEFDALYATLAPRVLALGFQMTGDAALAEDVLQETFLAVHRGLGGFRGDSDISTWVYRIAINASHRASKRRERAAAVARAAARGDGVEESGGGSRDRVSAVYRALDRLSPEHREVVSLLALRDLSPGVIADVLGVPVGTVHSRCHHARARLRAALDDDGAR